MVVPRTCKHIDSIFVRKPYVNEVISQICARRSVCLFFILKNTYGFLFLVILDEHEGGYSLAHEQDYEELIECRSCSRIDACVY